MERTVNPENDTLRTSWTLVARIKNLGDDASWSEFHELYRPLIRGVALKAGLRSDEADEVVQETMAAFAKKIQDFVAEPGHGSFRAWLLQMARWRITDQFRKRLPVPANGEPATSGTARTPTVERVPNAE